MLGEQKHVSSATLKNSFSRRSVLIGGLQAGVGVLLAARMAWIALVQRDKYETAAESNRVNLSLIPPRRGAIVDRNNAPLASNRMEYRIDIIPERLIDPKGSVTRLGTLLGMDAIALRDLSDKLEKAHGFQPLGVASGIPPEIYDKVLVRLPEMPGVVAAQGYTRWYPTGPSVGHLLGYVGPASAEDYKKERNPLLVTPGFKIGKDGFEKQFETRLRGQPGAKRVEVTATGKIVRDLEMREDVPGQPMKLAVNGPLQDYAARRIGLESGAVVVMDCESGDLLAMASMPSYDPNSFSDGIGRIEWKMLSDDDHVPLRNKVLRGLFPPGSTVKPAVALAFLEAGLDPSDSVGCAGGLRVGNRVFHCWNRRGHGTVDMAKAIYQSCDVYFYHFAQKIGMDPIAVMAKRLGMQEKFQLPVSSQSFGTVPSPAWKEKKYGQPWALYDTVNATIGQGYMLANPLQLAVMATRIATGRQIMPRMLLDKNPPLSKSLGFSSEHVTYVREAMNQVVNGAGTAGRAKLPLEGIQMAGKTGTAQVVGLNISSGKGGAWKYRDHGLFIFFAPFDNPRYAGAVVIEHGGGSGSAYPIARDVMTFMFDPAKGLEALHALEAGWGGDANQRMAAKYSAAERQYGTNAPKPVSEEQVERAVEAVEKPAPAPTAPQTAAASPAPEPVGAASPGIAPPAPAPFPSPGGT